jgi:hypothetical protein
MSKIEELQDQIQKLSPEEHAQLRNWFWDMDWIKWDAQIEADVKAGKLDELIATTSLLSRTAEWRSSRDPWSPRLRQNTR